MSWTEIHSEQSDTAGTVRLVRFITQIPLGSVTFNDSVPPILFESSLLLGLVLSWFCFLFLGLIRRSQVSVSCLLTPAAISPSALSVCGSKSASVATDCVDQAKFGQQYWGRFTIVSQTSQTVCSIQVQKSFVVLKRVSIF